MSRWSWRYTLLVAFRIAVAERSGDDADSSSARPHKDLVVEVHNHQHESGLDEAKVKEMVNDAARKAVELSSQTQGSREDTDGYSRGPPKMSTHTGVTITTGPTGSQMMTPPYMAPMAYPYAGYPMSYPGMPGGTPVNINIHKNDSDAVRALANWVKNDRNKTNKTGHEDHHEEEDDFADRRSEHYEVPNGPPPNRERSERYGGGHGRYHSGSVDDDIEDEPHSLGTTMLRDEGMASQRFHAEPDDTDASVRRLAAARVDQLKPLRNGGPRHNGSPDDLHHFSKALEEGFNKLEDTVPTISKERENAVDGMVEYNEKLLEWRQHLQDQTSGLNAIQDRVDNLQKNARIHWEADEKKRMERFDSLVDNGEGGLDCVGLSCGEHRSNHSTGQKPRHFLDD